MKNIFTLLFITVFLIGCASGGTNSQQATTSENSKVDYGDYTSQTLTTKAWEALGEGQYMAAIRYAEKCAELYAAEAREMQASLKVKAPYAKANDYWALNDVGTGYFIKGQALLELGRKEEAVAAFKVLKEELYFAQAWDPNGWFWAPADAAATKLISLTNDF